MSSILLMIWDIGQVTANGSAAFNNYSGGADIGQALTNGSVAVNGGVNEVVPIAVSR